jgi:ubiquinone/menaquinone biosynthesis C-methylase UbiE
MPEHVCPWWLGYFLASPVRRLFCSPPEILEPYVHEGMIVLEPGPGMGFFTLDLARMVGASGRVIAVDVQTKMLDGLRRRAAKAGLLPRVDIRLARAESMGLSDLTGSIDFALAFAVVHEVPSAATFFAEIAAALKSGAGLLLVEPAGRVKNAQFEAELTLAAQAGLKLESLPAIGRSHAALLRK